MEQESTMPVDNRFGVFKVLRRIANFHRERRGVAAMEFALIAPFMIALWLGTMELSQGVSIDRKVSHASSALADLVTQQTNITAGEMDDIMNATAAIMMPFNVANLSIQIAGVRIDSAGVTRVIWSAARNGTAPAVGGAYTIPVPLRTPDSFLVVANLAYAHTPVTSKVITGTINLTDDFFLRPRRSAEITFAP